MARSAKPRSTAAGPRLVSSRSRPVAPGSPALILRHEEVAIRAYQIFEGEGRVHGRDLEHWLRAEQELLLALAPAEPRQARGAGPGPRRRITAQPKK
jgi:hypothetical protein